MSKAHQLKQVDELYLIHQQAFQNLRVQGTKKSGKSQRLIYDEFKKFFDYDLSIKRVLETSDSVDSDQADENDPNIRYLQYLKRGG